VENTIASFDRALEDEGADGLEVDVCLTRDGEVVLWHDWELGHIDTWLRRMGLEPEVAFAPRWPDDRRLRRSPSELDLDDVLKHFGYARKGLLRERVASRVVTLPEFMAYAATKPRLRVVFFDVKMPGAAAHLAGPLVRRFEALVREHSPSYDIVLETRSARAMLALKREAPHRECALDAGPLFGYVPSPSVYSAVRAAIRHGNAVATLQRPPPSLFRPFGTYCRIVRHDQRMRARHNAIAPARMRVDRLVGYTVNDPDEMASCLGLGMDGLMTNHPARLARVIEQLDAVPLDQEDVAELAPAPAF